MGDMKEPAGGGNLQRASAESLEGKSAVPMLPPFDRERLERVRRLDAANESRAAARALDVMLATMYPEHTRRSEALDRRTADDLVRQGFARDYVARLYGLPLPRQAVAA